MTELPTDTNERVAEACGFTKKDTEAIPGLTITHWHEWCEHTGCLEADSFQPATDPAAAMFALEAYCASRGYRWQVTGGRDRRDYHKRAHRCHFVLRKGVYVDEIGDSPEHAICRAILAAEEARAK